jgi:hypothetical protein
MGTTTSGKEAMKTAQTFSSSSSTFQLNRSSIITGAALIGAGGLIALIGMIVSGWALAAASRQYLRDLEVPPSEVLRSKWGQTKAATSAGTAAWQQHNGIHRAHA